VNSIIDKDGYNIFLTEIKDNEKFAPLVREISWTKNILKNICLQERRLQRNWNFWKIRKLKGK
jgi:hypothetical protein